VVSLAFFAGAYNVEIFRSGVEAVQRATVEAADSLGMSRYQIYRHVVLPLALRFCLPALLHHRHCMQAGTESHSSALLRTTSRIPPPRLPRISHA